MKAFLKKVYRLIPFKKELYLLLKFFYKPKHSVYQHLQFIGVIEVPVDKSHSFKIQHYGYQLENALFWEGLNSGYEKISIGLWVELCKKSSVILDIGANTGVFSLIAKSINTTSKVYAFEPVQRIFDKLDKNSSLNNFDIHTIKKAASNTNGFTTAYDMDEEHMYSVTINKNFYSPDAKLREIQIETITLDSFIKHNNIPQIDLIKIDVETHEPEVLEGFREYLSIFKPTMLIEVLNDEIGKKIEQSVNGLGYLFFNIDDVKGKIRKMDAITQSDYFNYLLCTEKVAFELNLV